MRCTNCGVENEDGFRFCGDCGTPLSAPAPKITSAQTIPVVHNTSSASTIAPSVAPPVPSVLSVERRKAILDQEIVKWVRSGFQVVARDDTTTQLVKPKKLSCGILLLSLVLWLLVIGIFFTIAYLVVYMAGKPETVYLQVDEQGHVKVTRGRLG